MWDAIKASHVFYSNNIAVTPNTICYFSDKPSAVRLSKKNQLTLSS